MAKCCSAAGWWEYYKDKYAKVKKKEVTKNVSIKKNQKYIYLVIEDNKVYIYKYFTLYIKYHIIMEKRY